MTMNEHSKSRRPLTLLLAPVLAWLLGLAITAAPAGAAFGLSSPDVFFEAEGGGAELRAGAHPFALTSSFDLNTVVEETKEVPDGSLRNLEVELPIGMAGIPKAVPQCSGADFGTLINQLEPYGRIIDIPSCPDESAIGYASVSGTFNPFAIGAKTQSGVALYNLEPAPGTVAKFGFVFLKVPVTIEVTLSQTPPYRAIATVRNAAQPLLLYGSSVTVWGDPAADSHDPYRGSCLKGVDTTGALLSRGICEFDESQRHDAFLTTPRACAGPLGVSFNARPWEPSLAPDDAFAQTRDAEGAPAGFEDCEALGFEPSISTAASSERAESPTGLQFGVHFDEDEGLTDPAKRANSDLKRIVAKLPEGVTINPAAGNGLAGCTLAQYEAEALDSSPGAGCPEASKIGSISATSPLIDQSIDGSIYAFAPDDPSSPGKENPFDSFLGIYLVLRNHDLGVIVKQAGKVEADPRTGQLTSTFDDAPQLPIASIETRFRQGPRAPLATPSGCGAFTAEALETSWAGKQLTTTAGFEVSSGPGGAPCHSGRGPFSPTFKAGTTANAAGSYAPLTVDLTRRDGEADLTRLSMTLPDGLTGKLAGVGRCPEAAIAASAARSGEAELASPSCPPAARLGATLAASGAGPAQIHVPGTIYLAGPYLGAPFSVVAITPAVAGPFDLGNVIVRLPLRVDPKTGQASVDGASAAPLPRILEGIPVRLRELRVAIDRPGFTLNPTSCEPKQILATLAGQGPSLALGGETLTALAARYQAQGCGALGFKPKLQLSLKGATKRTGHPALRAVVTPRPGDANFSRAAVTLPRSAFLDQAHIRTICTRVQFAAGAGHGSQCPKGSVYGRASATSPLLDEALSGPVFLRSSDNNLPDLVVALSGPPSAPVQVELSARIDSVRGGIRSIFTGIPDLPVSRFVLAMQGGKKGLIVNSRNLCVKQKRNRARANLRGQNGRLARTSPRVSAAGCQKRRKKSNAKHGRGGKAHGLAGSTDGRR
jgi:hypothetical protein